MLLLRFEDRRVGSRIGRKVMHFLALLLNSHVFLWACESSLFAVPCWTWNVISLHILDFQQANSLLGTFHGASGRVLHGQISAILTAIRMCYVPVCESHASGLLCIARDSQEIIYTCSSIESIIGKQDYANTNQSLSRLPETSLHWSPQCPPTLSAH